ncbi:hypothetical protein Patl1_18094 [Pistacia atlantica]|uniref:Uncharacterized protein n=1 Tax=Pistacia atlantica TaxID=434234 RepID=A0ACC1BY92_9ROSI|nr:hypothetical protein Patl1_18094 [Pistacia atlantica]
MAPSLSKNALDSLGLLDGELTSSIILKGYTFLANGHPILTKVPTNIIATPSHHHLTLQIRHRARRAASWDLKWTSPKAGMCCLSTNSEESGS